MQNDVDEILKNAINVQDFKKVLEDLDAERGTIDEVVRNLTNLSKILDGKI